MQMKLLILVAALAPYCLAAPYDAEVRERDEYAARYRPCNLNDYRCIGDILDYNSRCTRPTRGPIAPRFVVPEYRFDVPFFNASYVETNLIIRNFNRCSISEFYINTATDRAVLGIDCPDLDYEGDRLLIQRRSRTEEAYCRYHYRAVYPLIRMTLVLPARNLELGLASTLTEVLGLPSLYVQSQDPGHSTSTVINRDLTPLNVFETEAFYQRGVPLSRHFVQSVLCDYGFYQISNY
nr:fibrohexamerin 5 [Pseudoips prasinana]